MLLSTPCSTIYPTLYYLPHTLIYNILCGHFDAPPSQSSTISPQVGLRSAVVHRDKVHVFAGAGLVPGSVATAEWAEIGLKMSQYLRVLRNASMRPAMNKEFPNATVLSPLIDALC